MDFKDWLEQKFLIWQSGIGKRQTLTAFAQHLGLSQPLISRYMSGQILPSAESVQKLADKLGPEVYGLLGLARPDPIEHELLDAFRQLDETQKQSVLAYVRRFGT